MNFFALSQAPPALAIIKAMDTQPIKPPPNIPPRDSGPRPKPTTAGALTAITPGRSIRFNAAEVAISTHLAVSGSALPSNKPGISLNCLLISLIISKAASPTAVMVIEEMRKGMEIPINIPTRTLGSERSNSKLPLL